MGFILTLFAYCFFGFCWACVWACIFRVAYGRDWNPTQSDAIFICLPFMPAIAIGWCFQWLAHKAGAK